MEEREAGRGTYTVGSTRNDWLKLLAMLTMVIDHTGYMFFPERIIFRSIGRLAFPIFAYRLAVGYQKTSNLKAYAHRLLVFGLISQVPYSFFSPDLSFRPLELNIMFTLLLSLGAIYVYDTGMKHMDRYRKAGNCHYLFSGMGLLAVTLAMIIAPEVLGFVVQGFVMDYGFYGVTLVLLFHIYMHRKPYMVISYILLSVIYTYVLGAKILAANSVQWLGQTCGFLECMMNARLVWRNIAGYNNGLITLDGYFFQARSIFALIPIYSFDRIEKPLMLNKYVGYWFYPVHIALLVIIAAVLGSKGA